MDFTTHMRLLVISGSSRRRSFNLRLARLIQDVRRQDDVTVVDDLYALPFYDADVEAIETPPAVAALRYAAAAADVVVLVTPEYNGTVPGVMANAVDWLSRPHGSSVLQGKPVVVLSASPSRFGAVRAAQHLRTVLDRIGAVVRPTGLSVAAAHQRLGDEIDPELAVQVADVFTQARDALAGPARLSA